MTYKEFQAGLIALGFDLGPAGADGVPGRMSQAATIAFKVAHGLTATPTIGPQTLAAMLAALKAAGNTRVETDPRITAPTTPPPPIWYVEAERNLGVREVVGRGSNPVIMGWAKRLGARVLGMNYTDDDEAWCGLFVANCVAVTLPAEPIPSIAVRAASWDRFGVSMPGPARRPLLGALARFQRPGGGHIAFIDGVSVDGRLYRVLGGNQGNRVSRIMIEAHRLAPDGLRWPATVKPGTLLAPIVDSAGAPLSRNEA